MTNYMLVIEYDGTAYHGFQIQDRHITIQGRLETAITKLAKRPVGICGSGRTDAGVHALNQVVNFHSDLTVPVNRIPIAVNSLLPHDIRVKRAQIVSDDFHARFSAKAKTYVYHIDQTPVDSVFRRNYCWWIKNKLNWDAIIKASKYLLGTHDFAAFAASGSNVKTTVRSMYELEIVVDDQVSQLRFTADGFLYNMVRNMVGTLVEVGLGRCSVEQLQVILAARDRRLAGPTAPAKGLFLEHVFYSDFT